MKILGIHGGLRPKWERGDVGFAQHDAAAALVRDGAVVAAVEDERLCRVKHANFFPVDAIRWALAAGDTTLAEVDRVAINVSEAAMDDTHGARGGGAAWLGELFARTVGVDVRDKLAFCHHHLAHAASAYFPSGFDRAVVVTLDGDGEGIAGMILRAVAGRFEPIAAYPLEKSIGNFYLAALAFLGYRRFDEYKVMGLAPHGDPRRFRALFEQAYGLLPGGDYRLSSGGLREAIASAGLVASARAPGASIEPIHRDYAAALQEATGRVILHVIAHASRATGERALCYAGGVAHNAVANGAILASGMFDDVFVQGAAHDAGGAIGAALWAWHRERPGRARAAPSLLLGPTIGGDEVIERRLERWRPAISFTRAECIATRAARELAAGQVIGWVQGRAEFGPRALGHRSIVADPRPAAHRELINAMIKKREAYRPFAPMVLAGAAERYFDMPATRARLADMNFVIPVRAEWRAILGAVTHVDGSARVQVVSPDEDPDTARLLAAFESLTGLPMLLNTSFNNDVEPIVTDVDEVLTCFLTSGLHAVAVGSFWIERDQPLDGVIGGWIPGLRGDQRLTRDHEGCAIESNAGHHFGPTRHPISGELFVALARGEGSLNQRLGADALARVRTEVLTLWDRRALRLEPRDEEEHDVGPR